MEHALTQMQYRFAVIYETPSATYIFYLDVSVLLAGQELCVLNPYVLLYAKGNRDDLHECTGWTEYYRKSVLHLFSEHETCAYADTVQI